MSYAIRNTIILLVVLFAIVGSGYSYIHIVQKTEIDELNEKVSELQQDYNQKSEIAEQLPVIQNQYDAALEFVENFDKALFSSSNPDNVYEFLIDLSPGLSNPEFNFVFNDSTINEKYGVINASINGTGNYISAFNFINRIENSQAVQKINNINITPVGEVNNYSRVTFNFELSSFYDRTSTLEKTGFFAYLRPIEDFSNPFFPLIRDIPPNEDNLTDVENSRLVGLTGNSVYLINQNGRMVQLKNNDPVFLGNLEKIDLRTGQAVFRLNKGGIVEMVTLEVEQ